MKQLGTNQVTEQAEAGTLDDALMAYSDLGWTLYFRNTAKAVGGQYEVRLADNTGGIRRFKTADEALRALGEMGFATVTFVSGS